MFNFLASLFFGWPAIVVTLVLASIGLQKRDFRFLVGAAILAFPFSLSISGFPTVSFPALCNSFLPLLLFAAGFFMSRGREMLAWILAIPYYLTIILLMFAVAAEGA